VKERVVIHLKDGLVPLPDGWSIEEAIRVLKEVGHTIKEVSGQGVAA
jgi:hypothetical protein